jgi:UDP-3-O-[3-hydroxymyristoyl] glucosamine N-acyltransferase
MLINYDPGKCLYIIGSSEVARGLHSWISLETSGQVKIVWPENFSIVEPHAQCVLAFWTIEYRSSFLGQYDIDRYQWPTYVHDRSFVSDPEFLGKGVVVYPMSYIGNDVRIGDFCAVGQLVSLGHSVSLGDQCVIGPGTVIGGSTQIGNCVYFGQSCSVRDKISICDNTKFSMTSKVTRSISESGEYYGIKKQQSLH